MNLPITAAATTGDMSVRKTIARPLHPETQIEGKTLLDILLLAAAEMTSAAGRKKVGHKVRKTNLSFSLSPLGLPAFANLLSAQKLSCPLSHRLLPSSLMHKIMHTQRAYSQGLILTTGGLNLEFTSTAGFTTSYNYNH